MTSKIMEKQITTNTILQNIDEYDFEILQEYQSIVQLYDAGIKEIKTKLEILDSEFKVRNDYNPIHHIEYRLKSPDSIVGKLKKRNLPVSIDSITNNLTDIAGVRVICSYVDDIYLVARLLVKQNDIKVLAVKDYIKNPKVNGYRSLHLVVEVPIFLAEGPKPIPVEIQIRTIAMDFWASLEHHIRYKTDKDVPESIRQELQECAKTICELDYKMQGIQKAITNE